jgi:hypothetical protein
VSAGGRRIAVLAALFAPERAGALLARLGAAEAPDAAAHAARLASAPRRDRLRALALALAVEPESASARAEAAASAERPRLAALLRCLAAGFPPAPAVSAAIVRVCRERIGR